MLLMWTLDVASKIAPISDKASEYWDMIISNVNVAYKKWLTTPHEDREKVAVEVINDPQYSRIKKILDPAVRDAIPESFNNTCMAKKWFTPEQSLYYTYTRIALAEHLNETCYSSS